MNQEKNLSKSAQIIHDFLYQKGVSCEVKELDSSTRTAKDAADTLGCGVAQIVKSLLFRTEQTHKPVLVLASGVNQVNERLVGSLINEPIRKADADFTREITGFAIGGVPPVGHKQVINTVLIDEDLLHHQVLWAAAGTPNAVFSLAPDELKQLTNGIVVKVRE
ncbi:YbaK/EbsC family protein [Legionella sp. PATHC035]|uniref:YbaK/EbsC family protein n=1 Tax=Legionella sp. PATHC035 TaxID=2992040 RepID=UPI0022431201|nr:YbaK/EbsC family protein [Legionella sp. PATHC035]MCW8408554.1 YbaK/EbsC family protein [Legionella sp. PATHC035]